MIRSAGRAGIRGGAAPFVIYNITSSNLSCSVLTWEESRSECFFFLSKPRRYGDRCNGEIRVMLPHVAKAAFLPLIPRGLGRDRDLCCAVNFSSQKTFPTPPKDNNGRSGTKRMNERQTPARRPAGPPLIGRSPDLEVASPDLAQVPLAGLARGQDGDGSPPDTRITSCSRALI